MSEASFISNLTNEIQWLEVSQDEANKDRSIYVNSNNLTIGTGLCQGNIGWYKEFSIPAGSSEFFSLKAMDVIYIGYELTRALDQIKAITVRNDSLTDDLIVTPSGVASGVDFVGQVVVGPSGIFSWNTLVGYQINNATSQINLVNNGSSELNCRVIIVGTRE